MCNYFFNFQFSVFSFSFLHFWFIVLSCFYRNILWERSVCRNCYRDFFWKKNSFVLLTRSSLLFLLLLLMLLILLSLSLWVRLCMCVLCESRLRKVRCCRWRRWYRCCCCCEWCCCVTHNRQYSPSIHNTYTYK